MNDNWIKLNWQWNAPTIYNIGLYWFVKHQTTSLYWKFLFNSCLLKIELQLIKEFLNKRDYNDFFVVLL